MKSLIFCTVLAIFCMVSVVHATDDLELTTPAPICTPDTHTMKIRSYVIIPPPNGRIEVYYSLCDSQGAVFKMGRADITGSDYTDVIGFSIRVQDVGTAIGPGLKALIWNKLKVLYGIDF